jgi:hypothetical protein
MTLAGVERRKSREKVLLAECPIRSEPFVDEVRGGKRGRRDKEPWDDAVPDLVR